MTSVVTVYETQYNVTVDELAQSVTVNETIFQVSVNNETTICDAPNYSGFTTITVGMTPPLYHPQAISGSIQINPNKGKYSWLRLINLIHSSKQWQKRYITLEAIL